MNDDVILADYDPRWPALFAVEAARIRAALRTDLVTALEYFGSTSVPGLAAKPVIDILVGVRSLSDARIEAVPALETLGYAFWDDNPAPEHLFFVKGLPPNGPRTYHVHIVQPDAGDSKRAGGLFRDRLLFRDYLRTHPDEAGRYGALKWELAARFPEDREAYTDAKGDYVRDITARARQQQSNHG